MNLWNTLSRVVATAALTLAAAAAPAAPVTLTLHGTITGYDFIDLGAVAGLTVGTNVDLTLSFNETWSDASYSFADPLGPVSGSATVGAHHFDFTGGNAFAYSYNGNTGDVNWVEPQFTGTGPTLGGGDFFGLFGVITPQMTLNSLFLGYGFTTTYPDGFSITNYGYAQISLDDYTITPGGPNPVPAPATLSLAMLGLLAAGFARRRA